VFSELGSELVLRGEEPASEVNRSGTDDKACGLYVDRHGVESIES